MEPRRLLPEILDAALRAVDGRACVAQALRDFAPERVELFAIGKAASSMARGAHDALGRKIRRTLVITKDGHGDPAFLPAPGDVTLLETAHPLPDERSLAAGEVLSSRLAALVADVHPVFLVSGGSSSLVEQLQPGVDLGSLRELNARGLAAGWDIGRLNSERARLSRLKGGGVARQLAGRAALALFISDVPDDDPGVIGSGLLGRGHEADAIERRVVASVDQAVQAAIAAGEARGLHLLAAPSRFAADVATVAVSFLDALRGTNADGLVWGGESTVTLPANPGRGGRNQHLALSIARQLGLRERLTILAAGTDGTDGPTDDAGAMVDAGTITRAEIAGVDVERAFAACDSGLALEAAGDLIHTGPTGTNVGDILIGLRAKARP